MADPEKLFESVEKWLSRIRLQAHKSPPVILVGTKADLPANHDSWAKKCQVLMTRHGEVAKAVKEFGFWEFLEKSYIVDLT